MVIAFNLYFIYRLGQVSIDKGLQNNTYVNKMLLLIIIIYIYI